MVNLTTLIYCPILITVRSDTFFELSTTQPIITVTVTLQLQLQHRYKRIRNIPLYLILPNTVHGMMRSKTASFSPYFVVVDFGNFDEITVATSSKQSICALNTQLHFDLFAKGRVKIWTVAILFCPLKWFWITSHTPVFNSTRLSLFVMRSKTASLSAYFVVVDFRYSAENTAAPSSKQRICALNTQLHFDLFAKGRVWSLNRCNSFLFTEMILNHIKYPQYLIPPDLVCTWCVRKLLLCWHILLYSRFRILRWKQSRTTKLAATYICIKHWAALWPLQTAEYEI